MKLARAVAVTVALAIGCGRSGLVGKTGRADDGGAGTRPDTASGHPPKPTAVFAGGDRACAVADDQVFCWNIPGCRQSHDIHKSSAPVRIQGLPSGIKAVAVGAECALAEERVLCWGGNSWGQLGNGTKVASDSAVQVQGLETGATAIAAGDFHACAIVNGGLRCWGWVQYGREFSNVPFGVVAPGSGVQAVSAGHWFTCHVMKGRAYCWGGNGNESWNPLPVAGLDMEVVAIDSSGEKTCTLGAGGIKCWRDTGPNSDDRYTTWGTSLFTVQGDMSSATAIAVGDSHSCALIAGGVQCWQEKWVGDRIVGTAPIPIQGLTSQVVGLAAGAMHTCALVEDKVQCWCDGPEPDPEFLTVQFP
jgi:hypothetical protein